MDQPGGSPHRAAATSNCLGGGGSSSAELVSNDVSGARRQQMEQLAQQVVEQALDEALQSYLRRELQQMAEETIREALIAAGVDKPTSRVLEELEADDNDDRTLTAGADEQASDQPTDRMNVDEILQDLSEMSNFVDRIDCILDQTASENSARSSRVRSVSPMPQQQQQVVVVERQQQQAFEGEPASDEVD